MRFARSASLVRRLTVGPLLDDVLVPLLPSAPAVGGRGLLTRLRIPAVRKRAAIEATRGFTWERRPRPADAHTPAVGRSEGMRTYTRSPGLSTVLWKGH
eukprot:3495609-Prymnesium_polylepis.1